MNPILELQALMTTANARLATLEKAQQEQLKSQQEALAATTELRGTFASISVHLTTLLEHDAQMQEWKADIEGRVKALERRQPPAA